MSGGQSGRGPGWRMSGSTTSASMTSGSVVHHNALSYYYHCIYFLSVALRNHIITGLNRYPDGTCRARHPHHSLDRVPKFGSSVKPPHPQVRQARSGVNFKIHASTTPGIAPCLRLLPSPSSPSERSTAQRVPGHRLGGMLCLPTVIVVHRRSSHDVARMPGPMPYADGKP